MDPLARAGARRNNSEVERNDISWRAVVQEPFQCRVAYAQLFDLSRQTEQAVALYSQFLLRYDWGGDLKDRG